MQNVLPASDRETTGSASIETPIVLKGARTRNLEISSKGLKIACWAIVVCFGVIGARLVQLGTADDQPRFDGRVLNVLIVARI